MFDGHPEMMAMLDEAEAGETLLLLPAVAIAYAERVLHARALWEPFLLMHGVLTLNLTEHSAIEAGNMDIALETAHVIYEAQAMNAIIVTASPDWYEDRDVTVWPLTSLGPSDR